LQVLEVSVSAYFVAVQSVHVCELRENSAEQLKQVVELEHVLQLLVQPKQALKRGILYNTYSDRLHYYLYSIQNCKSHMMM
jgi:hypothetical protein